MCDTHGFISIEVKRILGSNMSVSAQATAAKRVFPASNTCVDPEAGYNNYNDVVKFPDVNVTAAL